MSQPVNVTWSLHTHATVAPVGGEVSAVTLAQDGSTIAVKVLEQPTSTPAASFSTVPLTFAAPMLLDPGVSRVQLVLPPTAVATGAMARLVVAITSSPAGEALIPKGVRPLVDWARSGPF